MDLNGEEAGRGSFIQSPSLPQICSEHSWPEVICNLKFTQV